MLKLKHVDVVGDIREHVCIEVGPLCFRAWSNPGRSDVYKYYGLTFKNGWTSYIATSEYLESATSTQVFRKFVEEQCQAIRKLVADKDTFYAQGVKPDLVCKIGVFEFWFESGDLLMWVDPSMRFAQHVAGDMQYSLALKPYYGEDERRAAITEALFDFLTEVATAYEELVWA